MTKQQENSRRKEIRGFLEKIVIDAGIGRMSQLPNFEEKALVQVMRDLSAMTGQKPQIRRAKKSIAGFKIREIRSSACASRFAARKWLIFLSAWLQ